YEVCIVFAGGGHAVKPGFVYGMGGALYAGLGLVLAGWTAGAAGAVAVAVGLSGVAAGWWQTRRRGAAERWRSGSVTNDGWGWSMWAAVYVALPLALLVWLRRADLLWPLFLIIWANDVFAYVAGSSFKEEKRHKLAPRISPAKSWEGAVGGFCAAVSAGWVWAVCKDLPVGAMVVFASVLSVVGVLGDLLESYYKRKAGLKDSGALLGGHGGVLDRFDSVLSAAPVAVLLWAVWNWI
ncbi:MAG: phosphatidate cytidylyltransferase, partial [Bacteroidales bacterium]|nr:phosphatidate cytidylyltransferase [Bacteroidales bacterium]